METALFHKEGRRLFPAWRAMGHHPSNLASLFRRSQHRLVGTVLPGRQHATPYRASLRWLPLGQLQHSDPYRDGVECRLREMPRSRIGTRQSTLAEKHRQSGAAELNTGDEYLHSMPLPGPAADKPDEREILRLAGRISTGQRLERLLEIGRA